MADFRRLIGENRWTLAMIAFTGAFYLFLALPGYDAKNETPAPRASVQETRLSKEELKAREENFRKRLEANPRLFGIMTLLMGAGLFAGLAADAVVAWKRIRRRPVISYGKPQEDVPWGVPAVVRVFVLIFFLEAVILSVEMAVSLFIDMRGVSRDLLLMINSLLRNLIAAGVIVALVTVRYRTPLERIGLTLKDGWRNVRTGLLGYLAAVPPLIAVLFVMALLAKQFSYEPPPQPVVEMYIRESAPRSLLFFTVFVAILGPVMEELFFRGFAYKALRTRYGVKPALLSTALLFALLHTSAVAFVPIFLLGLFLNYLYEKTGSLVPGMAAHMAHNLIMVGCTLGFKALSG